MKWTIGIWFDLKCIKMGKRISYRQIKVKSTINMPMSLVLKWIWHRNTYHKPRSHTRTHTHTQSNLAIQHLSIKHTLIRKKLLPKREISSQREENVIIFFFFVKPESDFPIPAKCFSNLVTYLSLLYESLTINCCSYLRPKGGSVYLQHCRLRRCPRHQLNACLC